MADNRLSSITFSEGAYDNEGSRSDFQETAPFTAEINEWNGLVTKLDRVDQFENLSIEADTYAQTVVPVSGGRTIKYGIPHIASHDQNGGKPILPHQRHSALNFLQKLRGFGLLADVVGSGKTFEAGVVLSELAMRGLVSSVLFIVPKHMVGKWISTMESFFGLGKWNGLDIQPESEAETPVVLKRVGPSFSGGKFKVQNEYECPETPMITTLEEFAQSDMKLMRNKLFDVVVVDEAHNLSIDPEYDRAMAMLSAMMKTKIQAGKSYCLLLSATPHKGNLADMFNLWYFIRCKGGNPQDFLKDGYRSALYEAERKFYINTICRGATTVADFVRKEKISVLRGGDAEFCKRFVKFVHDGHYDIDFDQMSDEERETVFGKFFAQNYSDRNESDIAMAREYITRFYGDAALHPEVRRRFTDFLNEEGVKDFDFFYEGLKEKYINQFLNTDYALREQVKKIIARAYHHGVLRSIMIRQPKSKVVSAASKMRSVNLLYFRADPKKRPNNNSLYIPNVAGDEGIIVKFDPRSVDFMSKEDAITATDSKGKPKANEWGKPLQYSFGGYVERLAKAAGNSKFEGYSYEQIYSIIAEHYMKAFGLSNEDHLGGFKTSKHSNELTPESKYHFLRKNSLDFYKRQIAGSNLSSTNASYTFEPVYVESNEESFRIDYKYNKLIQILKEHENKRVIIFFDYDVADEDKVGGEVYRRLVADPAFKNRIIDVSDKEKIKSIFDAKDDAVLVVTDKKLTEGADFQKCNIIVNFQITPNPLEMQQRIGRVFRIGQEENVVIYSIAELFGLEGYVLAYFNLIGLISSDNSGDAEILAGCNNDNMVTVRCPKVGCGNIQLLSKEDFESRDVIPCSNCGHNMELMTDRNIKCSNPKCDAIMTRTTSDGNMYRCIYGQGTLCNDGTPGDRTYYCPKICVINHCQRFNMFRNGERKGKCRALEIYAREGFSPNLSVACNGCEFKKECEKLGCNIKNDQSGADSIAKCLKCVHFSTGYSASCRPHVIKFDRNWEAECPKCHRGKMAPVKRNSFESFIRGLFDFSYDGGTAFCNAFQGEIDKVRDIQEILRADDNIEEVNH